MLGPDEWLAVFLDVDWRFGYVDEAVAFPGLFAVPVVPRTVGPAAARPGRVYREYVREDRTEEPAPRRPGRRRRAHPDQVPPEAVAPPRPDNGAWLARFDRDGGRRGAAVFDVLHGVGVAQLETMAVEERRQSEVFDRSVVPEKAILERAARHMVTRSADADDLVQETLLRAFRSLAGFDGAHPRAWLFTIMRNVAINRSRQSRPEVLVAEDPETTGVAGPEAIVVGPTLPASLQSALQSLPEHQRRTVQLVDVDGFTHAEAAAILGVAPGTVHSRLRRARSRVSDRLLAARAGPRLEGGQGP